MIVLLGLITTTICSMSHSYLEADENLKLMEFFDVAKSMEKEATFQITFLRHDFKTEATKPNPNSKVS